MAGTGWGGHSFNKDLEKEDVRYREIPLRGHCPRER